MASSDEIVKICGILHDLQIPIAKRYRALFTLKGLGGADAVNGLLDCFSDESVLLKHEAAYCLGQMKNAAAIPKLITVLQDTSESVIVRHEAAEALGAIGDQSVKDVLEKYKTDPAPEVAETCEIALNRLIWLANGGVDKPNPYNSIDPAPALDVIPDQGNLRQLFLDKSKSLFDRYRAMFTLRDLSTMSSLMTLAEGLEDSSALFRHESAFVLGQLKSQMAEIFLNAVLCDTGEHEMVRHESAEAIGSIASQDCIKTLSKYLDDPSRLVKESCEVALDMIEYNKSEEFQYANSLQKLRNSSTQILPSTSQSTTSLKTDSSSHQTDL